jgi:hypothetical protein
MRKLWRILRTHWNRSDTVYALSGIVSLGLFVGNCWWESLAVCYVTLLVPLVVQLSRAPRDETVRSAHVFGFLVFLAWPLGEGAIVRLVGWWGEYLAPGPQIWDTPLYCMLIGWVASAHCFYVMRRSRDMGLGKTGQVFLVGFSAFLLGLIGENLFVGASMWVYTPSNMDFGGIPAFLPFAYGLGYGLLPLIDRLHIIVATVVFLLWMLVTCVGLGLLVGFFPA